MERVVWEREAEKEGACQGRARGFETSAVATLGCQKICPIENDQGPGEVRVRGGSPTVPPNPLEDEGFVKSRPPVLCLLIISMIFG